MFAVRSSAFPHPVTWGWSISIGTPQSGALLNSVSLRTPFRCVKGLIQELAPLLEPAQVPYPPWSAALLQDVYITVPVYIHEVCTMCLSKYEHQSILGLPQLFFLSLAYMIRPYVPSYCLGVRRTAVTRQWAASI